MASAQTIGREFFSRQVHQPNVARQFTSPTQIEEDRGAEHERRRGGVVIIRAGSRQPWAGLPWSLGILILHVGRVIMIRHDHRPPSVPAGNDDDEMSPVGGSFWILHPAAGPG